MILFLSKNTFMLEPEQLCNYKASHSGVGEVLAAKVLISCPCLVRYVPNAYNT